MEVAHDSDFIFLMDSSIAALSWGSVATSQSQVDEISKQAFQLPIAELRALGYRPPTLPKDAPVPGKDIEKSSLDIAVRDSTEIRLAIYKPIGPVSNALLFFNIHGGGWVLGQPETEEAQNRIIALKNKAVVVSVDYRKAPEYPYPIPLNDCYDAFQWCLKNASSLNVNPQCIFVGGGSAGANLSTVLVLKARAENITGILGQVLNIPVTCHPKHFPTWKYQYQSYTQNANAPVVDAWKMNWFWNQYLSALDEDVASDPSVAGMDPLRDEGLAYSEALKASGVPVTVKMYSGLPHAFYIHPTLPETAEYFQSMVDWIEATVAKVLA
ncbi:hypothetical protein LTS03_005969 [Exophiala xenobiotica]|nr:hypothetical protein LTR41_006295 [Exophiala xenobiotica]KAK5219859.1 hypothetical protein LTR72_007390 [Exophiala xenobiotica]KAK5292676.1 hypothetical protein LTR14_005025 [Exophiala xenobiotica]KAK5350834.1 hypothetical protein LTR61_005187 [Exophiala xenobiotica]KAK5373814.1 hypothetical protein LTS03_005969 [Exophiala xenobiotica]